MGKAARFLLLLKRDEAVALLDQFSGAAAAYSLRSLSASTTNVVKVRRSGDDAELDFTATEVSDGTLASWVTAGGGTEDGLVTTWYDQSGNGNDATQATAANQPKIVSSGSLVTENGKAAISHDGTDYTSFTELNIGQTHSIFTINKFTSRNKEILGRLVSPNQWAIYQEAANTYSRLDSNFVTFGGVITLNQQNLSLLRTPTTIALYENGVQVGTTQTPHGGDGKISNLQGESATYFIIGTIQEIIVYDSDQSANRTGIEANINDYYNIYP